MLDREQLDMLSLTEKIQYAREQEHGLVRYRRLLEKQLAATQISQEEADQAYALAKQVGDDFMARRASRISAAEAAEQEEAR